MPRGPTGTAGPGAGPPGRTGAVLVPVKAFAAAKRRLAPALDGPERMALARDMAARVVAAASPLPVWVACDDGDVARWAEEAGAGVVWTPGLGLDGAVERGVATLAGLGLAEVIVAHGDLPEARRLDRLLGFRGVTLVPDRTDDGTNVVCLPARCGFRFSYGPGSFARHCATARALRLGLRVDRDRRLSHDVDVPADLSLGCG